MLMTGEDSRAAVQGGLCSKAAVVLPAASYQSGSELYAVMNVGMAVLMPHALRCSKPVAQSIEQVTLLPACVMGKETVTANPLTTA